jgi:hypothetical protein
LRALLHRRPIAWPQMLERLVHLCKRNFKGLHDIVLIHIQAPMARIPLSVIHEFAHNIVGIAVRDLGVWQPDAEVILDSAVIIKKLKCVPWHCSAPADCKSIEAHPLRAVGTVQNVTPNGVQLIPRSIQQQNIGLSVHCRNRYSTIEF